MKELEGTSFPLDFAFRASFTLNKKAPDPCEPGVILQFIVRSVCCIVSRASWGSKTENITTNYRVARISKLGDGSANNLTTWSN